jgi:hypothetical protein
MLQSDDQVFSKTSTTKAEGENKVRKLCRDINTATYVSACNFGTEAYRNFDISSAESSFCFLFASTMSYRPPLESRCELQFNVCTDPTRSPSVLRSPQIDSGALCSLLPTIFKGMQDWNYWA